MSKKAILITLVSVLVLVVGVGLLSFYIFTNQPSADIIPPTPPTPPSNAPTAKPPVPPVPRLKGDILDDGIVDGLDINSIIVHWHQVATEYNLVDDPSDTPGTINALDLGMTIKYWKCSEAKGETACPYLDTATATASPTPTPTATTTDTSTVLTPPVPTTPTATATQ